MDALVQFFEPYMFVYTILFGLSIVYGISVVLGALDLDFLDFDVDIEGDMDIDIDGDIDADVDSDMDVEGGAGFFLIAAGFFNMGSVPFMILYSFWTFIMWIFAYYQATTFGGSSFLIAMLMFPPNLFAAALLTKYLSKPLIPMFMDRKVEFESNDDLIGKVATVNISMLANGKGQVVVPVLKGGAPLYLTAISSENIPIKKGDKVLIIDYLEDKKVYLVAPHY